MNLLDLFSGFGGFSLAADWAGIKTTAFCEIEPYPQKVLKKHWPDVPIFNDVRDVTRKALIEKGVIQDVSSGTTRTIDLISAGYP